MLEFLENKESRCKYTGFPSTILIILPWLHKISIRSGHLVKRVLTLQQCQKTEKTRFPHARWMCKEWQRIEHLALAPASTKLRRLNIYSISNGLQTFFRVLKSCFPNNLFRNHRQLSAPRSFTVVRRNPKLNSPSLRHKYRPMWKQGSACWVKVIVTERFTSPGTVKKSWGLKRQVGTLKQPPALRPLQAP